MAILPIGQFPFPNLCNLCSISPQLGSYLSLSDAQEAAAPSLRWQEKLPATWETLKSPLHLYTHLYPPVHLYTHLNPPIHLQRTPKAPPFLAAPT